MSLPWPNLTREEWARRLREVKEQRTPKALTYRQKLTLLLGGSGSGNFGHAGRPGEVGGSSPGDGSPRLLPEHAASNSLGDLTQTSIKPLAEDVKGINGSYKVVAESARGPVTVLYKPVAEQDKLKYPGMDYDEASVTDREVAAYEVDRALGFGLVPETAATRTLDHGPGVVHEWVKDTVAMRSIGWDDVSDRDWYRMGVLDVLIENEDRHTGNFLISEDGKGRLTAIDHGYAFSNSSGTVGHVNSSARKPNDERIPESERHEIAEKIRKTDWKAVLGPHLKGETLAAFKYRAWWVAKAVDDGTLKGQWGQRARHTEDPRPTSRSPSSPRGPF